MHCCQKRSTVSFNERENVRTRITQLVICKTSHETGKASQKKKGQWVTDSMWIYNGGFSMDMLDD